jgi:flagellar biosynthetic protein FliR
VNLPEQLLRAHVALGALELARLSGVVVVSPVPWHNAPARARVGLVLFLLLLIHGQGNSPVRELSSAGWIAGHTFSEFLVGASIGMAVRLSIAAAEIMGSLLAPVMGFSAAEAFDPSTGTQDSVLTNMLRTFGLLLAVASGLHRVMLGALLSSFSVLPVGTATQLEASFPAFLTLSGHVIGVGVRLAMPVLAVLLMVNIALGFISRAAPTMQIFNVGFAVLLGVGAVVLIITLPDVGRELVFEMSRSESYFDRLLLAFRGY